MNAPVWGIGCSGVAVATMSRSMSVGESPARLIASAAAAVPSVAVGLVGRGDAPLADAGALDDPRVVRVDARFEIGVRHAAVGDCGAPTDDRDRKTASRDAQPRDRLTGAQAFAGVRQHAHQRAAERAAAPGSCVPGPSTTPISSPACSSSRRRRRRAGGRRRRPGATIMRSGTVSVSPASGERRGGSGSGVVCRGGRSRCEYLREVGEIGGVAHESTGMSGTVRLATPAIIEPWPTSTNASAPSAASVSIDVRQRTGTVT